jgi:hypothetical protein
MSEIERMPIQEPSPVFNVIEVGTPLTLFDLMPKKQYQFQGAKVNEQAGELKEMLQQFLQQNEEIVINIKSDPDGYIEGFRSAISLVNLWIDSMYIEGTNQ